MAARRDELSRLARSRFDLTSLGTASGLARLGVVFCIALTLLVEARWLYHDALPGQNHWASLNAERTYAERTFPSDDYIGSERVAEDARLWMPRNATYRVVVGQAYRSGPWGWAAPNFLAGFLFPRRPSSSPTTHWIVCLGCDAKQLGPQFHILSNGGNGALFGETGA